MSETNNNNANSQKEGAETLTFTQAELDALIQREGDKRVSQAMKTANQKKEAEIKEAQKLAAMNEQEKFQYQLEQRENAIKAKELELTMAENKITGLSVLADKGLNASFIDLVLSDTAEDMQKKIAVLEKAFKDSVKEEVEKRLGSNAPAKVQNAGEISKEAFRKMSLAEQQNLYSTNPTLYKSLIQ